ncbi:MAG: RloB family protein [Actinokineospora sp.]
MAGRKPLAAYRVAARRSPRFAPRARFLVVCEGTATEPLYFQYVRNALRDQLLTIEVPIENGDPVQLVEIAARRKKEAHRKARAFRDDNEKFDQVWCVVDVDEHRRLPDAIRLAEREEISFGDQQPML